MACCCENSFNLGCANPCDLLELPALALSDADYTLEAIGVQRTLITQAQTAGAKLAFDISNLLQAYQYKFKIYKAGAPVLFEDGEGVIYDCFTLTTTIGGLPYFGAVSLISSL